MDDDFSGAAQISHEHSWPVISAFFEKEGLVSQQLSSFNYFINNLKNIVANQPPLEMTPNKTFHVTDTAPIKSMSISFSSLSFAYPTYTEANNVLTALWPHEARLRDLTYTAQVYCSVHTAIIREPFGGQQGPPETSSSTVMLARVPVMLKSSLCLLTSQEKDNSHTEEPYRYMECEYDEGGYFIVNGSEKAVLAQERMANNMINVFQKNKDAKFSWVAEVRCAPEGASRPSSATYVKIKANDGTIVSTITTSIKSDLPIAAVFRALGLETEQDIVEHVCYDIDDTAMVDMLRPSLIEGFEIPTRQEALNFIGNRGAARGVPRIHRVAFAEEVLEKEFLPHISQSPGGATPKSFYFGYLVHRLLQAALGRRPQDDRDHYGNKRMDMAGFLLEHLFRQCFAKLMKSIRMQFQKCIDNRQAFNVVNIIQGSDLSQKLQYCLATGNWGAEAGAAKSGVAQVLNRLTFISTLSHLRRLNTPIGSDSKLTRPRQLHNTHWGMVCPAETPEGHQCGLVKNLSLMTLVSLGYRGATVIPDMLNDFDLMPFVHVAATDVKNFTKVFWNGAWMGMNQNPALFLHNLRNWRHEDADASQVSIIHNIEHREIHIQTEAGRTCRPLFVVNDEGQLRLTKQHLNELKEYSEGVQTREVHKGAGWDMLCRDGVIDIVDASEEETLMIAMTPGDLDASREVRLKHDGRTQNYTHCEIHPSMILGVVASIIPFPDHNQSPRNTYQSAMGKQAIGVYATTFNIRMESLSHVLWYPQKPLARPHPAQYLRFSKLPAGTNVICAVACYSGYNQEDSVMLNQSSIDRGLFRSVFYRSYQKAEDDHSDFEKPVPTELRNKVSPDAYDKLDSDGFPHPGTVMTGSDILIGMTEAIPMTDVGGPSAFTREDKSERMRPTETGIVDSVLLSEIGSRRFVKVRMRAIRTPTIGDKFASRHGQKGTCGMLYRQEDMPYNRDGISPDLIMNPHAIPSRMTIGHMIECLLSKLSAVKGFEGDATPFADITVKDISNQLHAEGYQMRGNEVMYHGHTGRRMDAQLFMGPIYYQRLKHLVEDKMFCRATGRVQGLTRQPAEGRSKGGGLRFGEMERDVMIAHGSSQFLKERLLYQSDLYYLHICETCGMIATAKLQTNTFSCNYCRNNAKISQILLPYACKLLFQELVSMNIAPRLKTTPPPPKKVNLAEEAEEMFDGAFDAGAEE